MSSTESDIPEPASPDAPDAGGETEDANSQDNPPSVSLTSASADETLLDRVIAGVREVYDPEIPLNIYDLGLIYRVDIDEESQVKIDMTLTSPMCPVAGSLPGEVEMAARGVEGVGEVVV
ncbi:MAG TPA: hypothetical protein DCW50_08465, partial [Gammaproteobacteria bacterium]|nr:hypothetical protein [Gammaproteobacteria bacterium]